jgi:tRNA(Ile)-lysidine synthase
MLAIEQALLSLDLSKNWVIGYSGGRDSHVLLHAAAKLKKNNLSAIHVNHQINPNSKQWADHCQYTAKALGIECLVLDIHLDLKKGESLEAKARDARYEAIKAHLTSNDIFLSAHTQDDQAETLLLQLIRGSGVQGLSAMGDSKSLGFSVHYRPLLAITREEIEQASLSYGLTWITDDSNDNLRFDRNFIRHEILPLLKNRFKGVVSSLARSAKLCQEAAKAQERQAAQDFRKVACTNLDQINGVELSKLDFEHQKAVLRYWIAKNNKSYPSKAKLEDILEQINKARSDSMPAIVWGENVIRRYKQNWYIASNKSLPRSDDFSLEKLQAQGYRLDKIKSVSDLTLKYRSGGERCKPAGSPFSKSLKKWFQILEIPLWERNEIPLVYYQDELIGVLGYFICEGWQNN